jgi:hypothetical protein
MLAMSSHLSANIGTSVKSKYHIIYLLSIYFYGCNYRLCTNWCDFNAFRLPNSTDRCELIDKLHSDENRISRLLVLLALVGCKGSYC